MRLLLIILISFVILFSSAFAQQEKDISGIEISYVKKASAVSSEAMELARRNLKPGITEKQVAQIINGYIISQPYCLLSFPTLVHFGRNTLTMHALPSDTKLKKDDFVKIDLGAMYFSDELRNNHYFCSDMQRVYFIGNPPAEVKEAYELLKSIRSELIKDLIADSKPYKIYDKYISLIDFSKYDECISCIGHGVKYQVHEEPYICWQRTEPIGPGKIIALEPELANKEKEFSLMIEDTILITSEGCEILTTAPIP